MKKYDKEHIERADKLIRDILEDKREFSDYTQISLTIQDAVQAAADTWGLESEEQKYKLAWFIRELVYAKEKYLIKFSDGRYLKRSRYNYEQGRYVITKTENIYEALSFSRYSTAERLRADFISIACNEECEIIVKP